MDPLLLKLAKKAGIQFNKTTTFVLIDYLLEQIKKPLPAAFKKKKQKNSAKRAKMIIFYKFINEILLLEHCPISFFKNTEYLYR